MNNNDERREWTDADDAGLRYYLEKVYGITGKDRINDALMLVSQKHTVHPIRDYFATLKWDGTKRLDTMLTDYLGAVDSDYVRAVSRKSFTAAVARVMVPGIKYDTMPIFAGPQGCGKSTFLRILGKAWYSDSLTTFEGKDAYELIQGVWINEIGELQGLSRSETNAVKHFLSKTEDIFRVPYGRRTATYPRQCVFFGTTNEKEFLRDATGDRRFWPVDVGKVTPTKSVFNELEDNVDQIWAEALMRFQLGEPLYMKDELELAAKKEQEAHRESDAWEGIIMQFLDRQVPAEWASRTTFERKIYWNSEFGKSDAETLDRDKICAVEVWCECLGGDEKHLKKMEATRINNILSRLEGWERYKGKFGAYGWQRGFYKTCQIEK